MIDVDVHMNQDTTIKTWVRSVGDLDKSESNLYCCLVFATNAGLVNIFPITGETQEFIAALRKAADQLQQQLDQAKED